MLLPSTRACNSVIFQTIDLTLSVFNPFFVYNWFFLCLIYIAFHFSKYAGEGDNRKEVSHLVGVSFGTYIFIQYFSFLFIKNNLCQSLEAMNKTGGDVLRRSTV